MPLLNMRLVRPKVVVDINRIAQLDQISPGPDGGVTVGGLTRQSAAERSETVRERSPLLAEAMPLIAHFPIRNRGTIGGSLVHGDPAAELPAVSVALGAEVVLASSANERVLKAEDFFLGHLTTALEPAEVLTEVRIPPLDSGWGWGIEEVCRRKGDFALVGAVSLLQLDSNDHCLAARVTMFAVGATPVRIERAEEALVGGIVDTPALEAVAKAVSEAVDPPSDIHASAEYRKEVGGVVARRSVEAALSRAQGGTQR